MRTLDVDGRVYITINGKTFYLLRGYPAKRYGSFAFVQVHGTAPLTKDDLPEKNWEVILTRVGATKVYTAYKPSFFDGTNEHQLSVAATKEAAAFFLIRRLHQELNHEDAAKLAAAMHGNYSSGVTEVLDQGNSGVPAVCIEDRWRFNNWVERTLKEDT